MKNLVPLIVCTLLGSATFTQCTSEEDMKEILEELEKVDSTFVNDNDSITEDDDSITEDNDSIIGEEDSIVGDVDTIAIAKKPNPLYDLMVNDNSITLFCQALDTTGIGDLLGELGGIDTTYNASNYSNYYYTADFWREVAVVPPYKKKAFTLFVETDEILKNKYGITNLEELSALAKQIYDQTYPEDAGLFDDDVTNPKNPLYRFVAYHILTRDVQNLHRLTGLIVNKGIVNGPLGIKTGMMNPIEWYQTLLPFTMIKCEKLTVSRWKGSDCTLKNYYLNRRWDNQHQIRGAEVANTDVPSNAMNGRYFYADDLVAFTTDVRDKVQNMLIRMDFSTVFPELMTMDIRQNGDPTNDDNSGSSDETFKNGKNYWFPDEYLEGVSSLSFSNEGRFVYRRPHWNFWSYQGDEMMLYGDYDIEFTLPPVPFSGEWQVRLGYCALGTRGVAQIYVDNIPQIRDLDMRVYLDDDRIMGLSFSERSYIEMSNREKTEDQKALKRKGYYRGPYGGYHTDGHVVNEFVTNARTHRRVLCQIYIDDKKEHTLRIKNIGNNLGNNNEFNLDYLELVPQNVYNQEFESDL